MALGHPSFKSSINEFGDENVVYPKKNNGFADHYPYFLWLFHWGVYPIFRSIALWVSVFMGLPCRDQVHSQNPSFQTEIPGLVNVYKKLWKDPPMFNGKIHYFYGHFQ